MSILTAALYFGRHYIEAILLVLPIPDPKTLKESFFTFFGNLTSSLRKSSSPKRPQNGKLDTYTKNFNQAPESLGESDDEEELSNKKLK